MRAIILAAGVGSRLKDTADGIPKCLLEIGGKPIIEHQIEALADNGIHKIMVIVGYEAEAVKAELGKKVEYTVNERYRETNSLYSLWLAGKEWFEEPLILLNCDILFHPDILDRLLKAEGSALAFDSTSSRGLEQTKVAISKSRVVDLGKNLASEYTRGESIGMLKFNEEGAAALFNRAEHHVSSGDYNSWVIEAVRSACSDIFIKGVNIAGLPWAEIDFPVDLERARKEVWPEIERIRWKHVIHWKKLRGVVYGFLAGLLMFAGWSIAKWKKPPVIAYEILAPFKGKAEKVKISIKNITQNWWLCKMDAGPVEVEVEGPDQIRIDVRHLMPAGTKDSGRYVVELALNGKAVDWHSFKSEPVSKASYLDYIVGDRDKMKVDVPAGIHTLQIKIIAGTSKKMLVRVRRPELVDSEPEWKEEE